MKVLSSICIIFEEDKLHLGIKNERVHFILFSVYIIFVALMNTIIVEGGKDMGNRIYPIGIQNFEKIRKEGYVYVDKTALMYKLVKQRGTATRIPQYSETFLWRTENHGRLHQVCLADGSDQVRQSQCVQ